MDEITAVEILRKVLTGNQRNKLPLNSVQEAKQKSKASAKVNPVTAEPPQATQAPTPDPQQNYVDKDWDVDSIPEPHPGIRRSKRTMQQIRGNEKEGLHRISALAAKETATIPDLTISKGKITRGWTKANQNLQLDEWAFKQFFLAPSLTRLLVNPWSIVNSLKDQKLG